MKKILAILSAMAIILPFAGCGSKKDETEKDSSTSTTAQAVGQTEADDPQADNETSVMKIEGVDFNISLADPSTYWKQDVDTMEYNNDADDGITLWARDTTVDNSTVSIQSLKDQTYKGSSEERTKAPEFADYTFNTEKIGEYTLYHAQARENSDGYKEEHMFVDFNGCTLSFYGCYYNFETFCEFLEATLGQLQVQKVEG